MHCDYVGDSGCALSCQILLAVMWCAAVCVFVALFGVMISVMVWHGVYVVGLRCGGGVLV